MSVSVVICTYNRAQLLKRTLHSLTLQTVRPEQFEIIVVDDGSVDETPDFPLPIILAFGIFAKVPQNAIRKSNHMKFIKKEKVFLEDAHFLLAKPGPALCENILLCYYADKPFEYDPSLVGIMMVKGLIEESKVLNLLEVGYFRTVQLEKPISDQYHNGLAYTTVKRTRRFTENFNRALGKHYVLTRQTSNGAFYEPRDKLFHRHHSFRIP